MSDLAGVSPKATPPGNASSSLDCSIPFIVSDIRSERDKMRSLRLGPEEWEERFCHSLRAAYMYEASINQSVIEVGPGKVDKRTLQFIEASTDHKDELLTPATTGRLQLSDEVNGLRDTIAAQKEAISQLEQLKRPGELQASLANDPQLADLQSCNRPDCGFCKNPGEGDSSGGGRHE